MTQNLLVATDNSNHGSAFYMLTGTNDFEYILDTMIANNTEICEKNSGESDIPCEPVSFNDAKKQEYLQKYDGYRLRFMMVGMKKPLVKQNDTEAICLYSETAGGALCAGIIFDGT